MLYFIKFVYTTFLLPPGIFIIGLVFLSVWAWRQKATVGKGLALFTLVFYLFTIPLIGDTIIRSLESRHRPPERPQGDVIIVLGGGATLDTPNLHGLGHLSGHAANRLLTGAQLYHKLKVPIVVSGGKVLETTGCEAQIAKNILTGLGVPENQIYIDDKSLNTTENAKFTKSLMAEAGFHQPILVTSAFHMERSVLQFKKFGVEVVAYPTDYQSNLEEHFAPHHLWPSADVMESVSLSVTEYIGIWAVKWY